MKNDRAALAPYLQPTHPTKRWAADRMIELLVTGGTFPAFSVAVQKLVRLAEDDDVGMHQLAAIIDKEPGLAANCLRVAATMRFGTGVVRSVEDAALRLGTREIHRVACSLGVMNRFNHLKVNVNWDRFWLHSLLVARLSDRIAGAFRQSTGMEYLAGLLHDSGKLLLEHYLPREFENVLQRAWCSKRGHFVAEREMLGWITPRSAQRSATRYRSTRKCAPPSGITTNRLTPA
jgi:HD-like signal output (HDOD) protein